VAERWLKFLGTAGARFVVAKQARHSGGYWYRMGGVNAWLDPGPGALVRALAARPRLDPEALDVLLLSHRHLDHANDANAVIEAMTQGGKKKRGALVCPRDCLGDEPAVASYLRGWVERTEIAEEGALHAFGGLTVRMPIAHRHGIETYGYVFSDGEVRVGHVVDTAYFPELESAYRGCDVLVLHVTRETGLPNVPHLDAEDARRIVAAVRPRLALLCHFGMQLACRGRAGALAARLTEQTGVRVQAARDGQQVDLG
jgi:ribonuclease BN (tRNA processing enzyme)